MNSQVTNLEQVDIAVDLGVMAAPLPEIEFLREFAERPEAPPAELIDWDAASGLQDDPWRDKQEQQELVPAGPGAELYYPSEVGVVHCV